MVITMKELKELARTCRKAGVKYFKTPEFEFTLTDEEPPKSVRRVKKTTPPIEDETIESETLNEEALLFWSTQGVDAKEA